MAQAQTASPERNGRAPASLFVELGTTGLKRFSGRVFDEWLTPELTPLQVPSVYRRMRDTEPMIGSSLWLIALSLRQVPWQFLPADNSEAAHQGAAFAQSCLDDMSHGWSETLTEILSMLQYGWAWMEMTYKKRLGEQAQPSTSSQYNDGLTGWRKWEIRGQETRELWQFDAEGGIQALIQRDPVNGQLRPPIPIEKSLLFRLESHLNNPEGRSVLRSVYEPWKLKRTLRISQALGLKRDLEGIPLIETPVEVLDPTSGDLYATQRAAFQSLGKDIARDRIESILFPLAYDESGNKLYQISLISGAGNRRVADIEALIRDLNVEMTVALLTDLLLVGHEKTGTQSMHADKREMFGLALAAVLDVIRDVINRHAMPRLWRLNGFDIQMMPHFTHGVVTSADLKELGSFILALSQAGLDISAQANEALRRAGFPLIEEGLS